MKTSEITSLSYEQAQQELRDLVEQMEDGKLPLEDLVRGCERGAALRKHCEQLLNRAEQRVQLLLDGNGEQRLEELPEEAGEEEAGEAGEYGAGDTSG